VSRALTAAGLPKLLKEAAGSGPITVVVNDPHRPTRSNLILTELMALADSHDLHCSWRLLVATGSHLFEAAVRRRHEEGVLGSLRGRFADLQWHDPRRPDTLAPVGPYRLHRWLVEGAVTLGVGSLEPHYFAGVTGAHKTLTVGLMSLEDLTKNHQEAMEPRAAPLALDGNPVFEEMRKVLTTLEESGRRLFGIDELLVRGRLAACTAGPPLEALRLGVPAVRRTYVLEVPSPVDLIVSRVAPPLDQMFYQADKGIKNVEAAVRDGGVILLEAACPEGVGIDRFMNLLRRTDDYPGALAWVREAGYRLGDHKAVRLRHLTDRRGVRVGVVSAGIPEADARALQINVLSGRREAARWALELLGRSGDQTGLVVEDAGHMVVEVRGSEADPEA
jgi:nickel-dependent lactate racemase